MAITWGYVRVSTDDQGAGLGAQKQVLIKAGVDERFLRIDDGVSGTRFDRPALVSLLEEARKGDLIIVHKPDRLGRSLRGVLNLIAQITERKIALKILDPDIDTTTPMGTLLLQMLLAFAELERNMISSRTKAALAEIKRTGLGKSGNPVKIGRKAKVTDEDVEEMRRLRKEGTPISAIARRYKITRETVYAKTDDGTRDRRRRLAEALDEESRLEKYQAKAAVI